MLTLLNIGNTHVGSARFDGAGLRLLGAADTAEFDPDSLPAGDRIAVASVVPELSRRIAARRPDAFFLSAATAAGLLDFSRVDSSTLGADRIANAIAAAEFHPLPAIVIDCGSAITVELVDVGRRFSGGAIAPGRRLMRLALARGTAQLPGVETLSATPPAAPGRNTVEQIICGTDRGAVGMAKELAAALSAGLHPVSRLLTGGDAPFFAPELPEFTPVPADFTLRGLLAAALGYFGATASSPRPRSGHNPSTPAGTP